MCPPVQVKKKAVPCLSNSALRNQLFLFQLYSITNAIAAVISASVCASTVPNFSTNRSTSTPRNWSVSTTDVLVKPFCLVGSKGTSHHLSLKWSCHPVIGATRRSGSARIESELTTTTGRVLRISEPTVGSRFTRLISPCFGFTGILKKVASLPCVILFVSVRVVSGCLLRLCL